MNDGNGQLKSYIDRLQNIEGHRRANVEAFKDVLSEAKSNGFDPKALRAIVKLQFEDTDKREKREEYETILETYMNALGTLANTPLGESAIERATRNSKKRTTESMKDHVSVTRELADAGLISQEAARETEVIAAGISKKYGVA